MPRFDILNRNVDVFSPHFLEASAGTGKTFAIEHLVVRLILEANTPLHIEQILVVTFTRAATRELKMRIRRNLYHAKEALKKGEPHVDYLRAICEKGSSAIQEALDRMEASLICLDAAPIFTLHGFCYRILKEFAFEANITMDLSDPEDQEHLFVLEREVKEFLRSDLSQEDYSIAQLDALFQKHKGDVKALIQALVNILAKEKEIEEFPSFSKLHEHFVLQLQSLPFLSCQELVSDYRLVAPCYKEMGSQRFEAQLFAIANLLETKRCDPQQFDALLREELFLEKMHPGNQKVRAKFPEEKQLASPGIFALMRERLLPSIRMARDPMRIQLRLGKEIQKKTAALRKGGKAISFDALLHQVNEALSLPGFADRLRSKYRVAIVDEFQDTDPVQWNIINQIFSKEKHVICLVGDPKQSIYAFRDADVYTYLKAAEFLGPEAKKHLDTNFRSTPSLIEALNALFTRVKEGWMPLPQLGKMLEVIPVKATLSQHTEGAVHFFISEAKPGIAVEENSFFPFIAASILKVEKERKVKPEEIAVLVKDRHQAARLIEYLNTQGIAASFRRGRKLSDTAAFYALKELLIAVCRNSDLSALTAALLGPLIGWGNEQVDGGWEHPEVQKAKLEMHLLKEILFEKGFGPFFQAALTSSFAIQEKMLSSKDAMFYLEMRKLAELLIEEEMEQGLQKEEFITFLSHMETHECHEDSRFKISAQEEKGSVALMSIHMSKGLEFDTVFALALASRHALKGEMTLYEGSTPSLSLFDPDDPRCQRRIEELDAEKMRQLYVALTRAKTEVFIPVILDPQQKEIEDGAASAIELFLARMTEAVSSHQQLYQAARMLNRDALYALFSSFPSQITHQFIDERTESHITSTHSHPLALTPPLEFQPLWKNLYAASFSSLSRKKKTSASLMPGHDQKPTPHTLPLGSDTGQSLHRIMEHIFKLGIHHPLDSVRIGELIERELPGWEAVLLPWIIDLLSLKLIDGPMGFCLTDLPENSYQQEMEFAFETPHGLMKGFIDLLFEYQGKYYVLDWKSNYLGPSDAEYTQGNMEEAMHSHDYLLQGSIYRTALEKYVKLFDIRPFDTCFGGAIYLFMRGRRAYHFLPNRWEGLA